MGPFKHFPEDMVCPMCGMSADEPFILIPIDETDEGNICEFIPVHQGCIAEGKLRYNKEMNIFYRKGKELRTIKKEETP